MFDRGKVLGGVQHRWQKNLCLRCISSLQGGYDPGQWRRPCMSHSLGLLPSFYCVNQSLYSQPVNDAWHDSAPFFLQVISLTLRILLTLCSAWGVHDVNFVIIVKPLLLKDFLLCSSQSINQLHSGSKVHAYSYGTWWKFLLVLIFSKKDLNEDVNSV